MASSPGTDSGLNWRSVALLVRPFMARTIAIVEDDPIIRENHLDSLRRSGFNASGYGGRAEAEAAFETALPDLVIIDIGLGEEYEGGFELCRRLRARSASLPIMFLTARDSELDAVSGLRLGADDYLTKDISQAHLLARIQALFRRLDSVTSQPTEVGRIRQGALTLDPDRLALFWHDQPVGLTVTEFWIVHALARRPGHVKTREQLMDAARLVVDETTITSHIKRIRRKFEALDPGFQALETVHGAGYRWC